MTFAVGSILQMSKSAPSDQSRINVLDPKDVSDSMHRKGCKHGHLLHFYYSLLSRLYCLMHNVWFFSSLSKCGCECHVACKFIDVSDFQVTYSISSKRLVLSISSVKGIMGMLSLLWCQLQSIMFYGWWKYFFHWKFILVLVESDEVMPLMEWNPCVLCCNKHKIQISFWLFVIFFCGKDKYTP